MFEFKRLLKSVNFINFVKYQTLNKEANLRNSKLDHEIDPMARAPMSKLIHYPLFRINNILFKIKGFN